MLVTVEASQPIASIGDNTQRPNVPRVLFAFDRDRRQPGHAIARAAAGVTSMIGPFTNGSRSLIVTTTERPLPPPLKVHAVKSIT
jgi:hypothetical protein